MKKITNYFKLVKFLNNSTVHLAWYNIVESVMKFATEVQQNGKPMLTRISVIDMSAVKVKGHYDMVSIWAGVGNANPIERCGHLKAQNEEMKNLLRQVYGKIEVPSNENLLTNIKIVLDTFE